MEGRSMTRFVGADAPQTITAICVIDNTGRTMWSDQSATESEQIARVAGGHARENAGIGIETG